MARRENFTVNNLKVNKFDTIDNTLYISPAGGDTVYIGTSGTGDDIVIYGDTAGAEITFDQSADEMIYDGIDIHLNDSDELRLGDATTGDIVVKFDGADLSIVPASAVEALLLGGTSNNLNVVTKGTFIVGQDDTGYDVTFFGATTAAKVQWDESDDALEFTKSGIEFISCKTGAQPLKFADDGAATCADLCTSVGTINGAIKVMIGSTVGYIPTYVAYH